jgi:4-hydroxy-tetrahydrodipicolinate reductase
MKIALIGYGKMGKMVEKAALSKGHTISAILDPRKKITNDLLKDAQVCIDFSHPECALDVIQQVVELKKDLVVGTTGWYQHLEQVTGLIKRNQVGLLYSPNFSIGVHLFLELVKEAAVLLNPHEAYDVGIIDAHHSKKADSPSGTAKAIAKTLLDRMTRKKVLLEGNSSVEIPANALQISSLRCGSIPGTHSVIFDSPADSITITHEARSREGFAAGAVTAAQWLHGRKGLYTIEDVLI